MPERKSNTLERCCERCEFFMQHYIRIPDEEMLIFKKSRYGSCIHFRRKITQVMKTCPHFSENPCREDQNDV